MGTQDPIAIINRMEAFDPGFGSGSLSILGLLLFCIRYSDLWSAKEKSRVLSQDVNLALGFEDFSLFL